MKLDDSDVAARLTAGATEVCCKFAITPISVSDSVANASLRAEIGPRSTVDLVSDQVAELLAGVAKGNEHHRQRPF